MEGASMTDWVGNSTSIYATHGASNHSDSERAELDYYATDPETVEKLLKTESFDHCILEPACGGCHISKVLIDHGFDVVSNDIVSRGSEFQTGVEYFLKFNPKPRNSRDIITNPPYKFAAEFAEHALDISQESVKVAMFLKLTFLEGTKRKRLFDKYPPKKIYVFRNRVDCWKNGIKPDKPSKAVCYAWFVWEKGFLGSPKIDWI
jgi:hypothetical protein